MADPQVQPQIEGLPPGAILKPIQQPAIQGLPSGAILKPIGGEDTTAPQPASLMSVPDQMERAKNRDYGQTSIGPASAPYKAPADPYAVHPNSLKSLISNAGIPTSQPATTEAVRSLLSPDADPAEQDKMLRFEEQIPILGGDFRARAALAKRAANESGVLSAVHKVSAYVPLVGPAMTAAQDKADEGDYTGAVGAGFNALLSLEGLKGAIAPKPTVPEGLRPPSDANVNQPAQPPTQPGTYTGPPADAAVPARVSSKMPEAMAKSPIKQQTAAGSATNAAVAAYAKSKGIDLLPGQATGSRGLQTVQAIGERAVIMPGELPDVLERQKAAFGNLVDDFKTRVGTEAIPDTESAGTSLKSQAQAGLDDLKQSAQNDYSAFQQQTGDIPVDLGDVKAKYAQKLADQAEALKNVPAQYANPVRNVLKKLSDIQAGGEVDPRALADFNAAVDTYRMNPEQQAALRVKMGLPAENGNAAVKMSTAQQLRSAYLDIARDYSGNVPKPVQRIAGQAANDIDAAMAKAADQVGATDQWRQANAKWKQLQQTYNNPDHPLYKILQESDPSKVPSRLLGKGNYGGSPQTVRQLQQAGLDLSPLKREVAQQIADRNFALTNGGRGLAGYSTEFLQQLYSPEEFNELTKMGRVGRAIKFEMNPSGTSNVQQGERQFHGIIHRTAGAVVGPLASRLTTSKALARATMGDIVPEPPSLVQILRGGSGEPPALPPAAGSAPQTPSGGTPPVTPTPQRPSFLRGSGESAVDEITRRGPGSRPSVNPDNTYIRPRRMGTPQGIADQVAAAKNGKTATTELSRVDQHKITKTAIGKQVRR